jgi:hypothetical protein
MFVGQARKMSTHTAATAHQNCRQCTFRVLFAIRLAEKNANLRLKIYLAAQQIFERASKCCRKGGDHIITPCGFVLLFFTALWDPARTHQQHTMNKYEFVSARGYSRRALLVVCAPVIIIVIMK